MVVSVYDGFNNWSKTSTSVQHLLKPYRNMTTMIQRKNMNMIQRMNMNMIQRMNITNIK